jgi:hypothetical protein
MQAMAMLITVKMGIAKLTGEIDIQKKSAEERIDRNTLIDGHSTTNAKTMQGATQSLECTQYPQIPL